MQTTTCPSVNRSSDTACLLPAVLAPNSGVLSATQMRDVLHDAVECTAKQLRVLVVHGNHNEHLSLSRRVAHVLTQTETGSGNIVWVGQNSSIPVVNFSRASITHRVLFCSSTPFTGKNCASRVGIGMSTAKNPFSSKVAFCLIRRWPAALCVRRPTRPIGAGPKC